MPLPNSSTPEDVILQQILGDACQHTSPWRISTMYLVRVELAAKYVFESGSLFGDVEELRVCWCGHDSTKWIAINYAV